MNPLIRTTISTTRVWTDTNRDFVPNCDLGEPREERRMRGHGQPDARAAGVQPRASTRTSSPAGAPGRTTGAWACTVQQEVAPRVSVNVGYFRNWWGNWYVVDNRATSLADYTPFSIMAPVDPRLPGGGGQSISGLYNLVPRQGRARWTSSRRRRATSASRPRTGRAWTSTSWRGCGTGSRCRAARAPGGGSSDACGAEGGGAGAGPRAPPDADVTRSIAGAPPSVTNPYCRVEEPYRTQFRGLATYTIPKVDVQVSGTWSSTPGETLAANFVVTNADRRRAAAARPQSLGRRQRHGEPDRAGRRFFADRRNNIDFRVAKIFRVRPDADAGRHRRLQPDEHRRGDGLQPGVRGRRRVADADGDSAGAVREDQRADRLLSTTRAVVTGSVLRLVLLRRGPHLCIRGWAPLRRSVQFLDWPSAHAAWPSERSTQQNATGLRRSGRRSALARSGGEP